MRDLFFFFIRYTIWWSIPLMMICIELGRRLREKDAKKEAMISFGVAFICLLFTAYFVLSGGPDNSVRQIIDFN